MVTRVSLACEVGADDAGRRSRDERVNISECVTRHCVSKCSHFTHPAADSKKTTLFGQAGHCSSGIDEEENEGLNVRAIERVVTDTCFRAWFVVRVRSRPIRHCRGDAHPCALSTELWHHCRGVGQLDERQHVGVKPWSPARCEHSLKLVPLRLGWWQRGSKRLAWDDVVCHRCHESVGFLGDVPTSLQRGAPTWTARRWVDCTETRAAKCCSFHSPFCGSGRGGGVENSVVLACRHGHPRDVDANRALRGWWRGRRARWHLDVLIKLTSQQRVN
jgi:hypothetical protein